jgi:hypothetical protein
MNQEAKILNDAKAIEQDKATAEFKQAPDVFIAAAMLHQNKPKIGAGDVSNFIKALQNGSVDDAKKKLKLLIDGRLGEHKLIFDKFKAEPPAEFKIAKKKIYGLWLNFVRKERTMTTEDFLELFPHRCDEIEMWEKFIDKDGNIKEGQQKEYSR